MRPTIVTSSYCRAGRNCPLRQHNKAFRILSQVVPTRSVENSLIAMSEQPNRIEESFADKAWRKTKEQPLVPAGVRN